MRRFGFAAAMGTFLGFTWWALDGLLPPFPHHFYLGTAIAAAVGFWSGSLATKVKEFKL